MNHGFSESSRRGPILPYLSAFGLIWLCVWVDLVRIYYYSLRGNTREKAGGATVHSLKSQRDPGEYIAFPRAFSALFKSNYSFIQSVPEKFKVLDPC